MAKLKENLALNKTYQHLVRKQCAFFQKKNDEKLKQFEDEMLKKKEQEIMRKKALEVTKVVRFKDEIVSQMVYDAITCNGMFSSESVAFGN